MSGLASACCPEDDEQRASSSARSADAVAHANDAGSIPGILAPEEEVELGAPDATLTKRIPVRQHASPLRSVGPQKQWLEPRVTAAFGVRGLYLAAAFWATQRGSTLEDLAERVWDYSPSPVGGTCVRTQDEVLRGLAWCSETLEERLQYVAWLSASGIDREARSHAKRRASLGIAALRGIRMGLLWLAGDPDVSNLDRAAALLRSTTTQPLHAADIRTSEEIRWSLRWFTAENHFAFARRGMWLALHDATSAGEEPGAAFNALWDLIPVPLVSPWVVRDPAVLRATADAFHARIDARVDAVARDPSLRDPRWWLTTYGLRGFELSCRTLAGDLPSLEEAEERLR